MSYEKEIILINKEKSKNLSAIEIIGLLKNNHWEPTLSVINRGNDFDWIDSENLSDFQEILRHKTRKKEYIGFALKNKLNNRFVHINMDHEKIIFSLDIGRNENELEWFNWFYENLFGEAKELVNSSSRIEWRTNYDNEIIKLIQNESE